MVKNIKEHGNCNTCKITMVREGLRHKLPHSLKPAKQLQSCYYCKSTRWCPVVYKLSCRFCRKTNWCLLLTGRGWAREPLSTHCRNEHLNNCTKEPASVYTSSYENVTLPLLQESESVPAASLPQIASCYNL